MIESTKDLDGTHRSRDYLDAGTKAVGGELRVFSMENGNACEHGKTSTLDKPCLVAPCATCGQRCEGNYTNEKDRAGNSGNISPHRCALNSASEMNEACNCLPPKNRPLRPLIAFCPAAITSNSR
jgi:hypothetical protein